MSPRIKKLIGLFGMIVWFLFYAVLVMQVAVAVLPGAHWAATLLFYALTGTLWAIPVGLALPWMHREPRGKKVKK